MNRLNFNQSVGFPLETEILDSMQTAYSLLNALGAISGNFSIISGCELTGSTVANGVVYINGEVLEFRGGNVQTNVKIFEEIESLEFEDADTTHEVIFTRYVGFGTATIQWAWATFKRGMPTIDIEAALRGKATTASVNALTDAVNAILTKLNTIAAYAEVNVRADWNATAGDGVIDNKPAVINYLAKGSVEIGDVGSPTVGTIKTVSFSDVGTNNYMVLGCMISNGSNYLSDFNVIWMIREKSNTSFKITLGEVNSIVQNLSFEYMLIPL
jgi:hypothetical protein